MALISRSGSTVLATERNYNSNAASPQRKVKKMKKAKKEPVEEAYLTATKQASKTS